MYSDNTERQPLTASSSISKDSETTISVQAISKIRSLNVSDTQQFLRLADDAIFGIDNCKHCFEKLQEAQKDVFQHAVMVNDSARKSRANLKEQSNKVNNHLDSVRQIIYLIEPSKPNLSDLDLRNEKFKRIVRSYKDFLEKYINLVLESQRFTAVSLENQMRLIYPNIASSDLEKAINAASPVMLQVLLQKGVIKNDKDTQLITHSVQDIHQDLRQLNSTFLKVSEARHEANMMMERYRRRWPLAIKQGKHVYVINDDLNLLEKTHAGGPIDYDRLLRKREKRNKIIVSFISIVTVIIVVGLVVSTTLFSDF